MPRDSFCVYIYVYTTHHAVSHRAFLKILSFVNSVLKVWKILEVNNLFLIRIILAGHSETGQYINQNKYMAQQIVWFFFFKKNCFKYVYIFRCLCEINSAVILHKQAAIAVSVNSRVLLCNINMTMGKS